MESFFEMEEEVDVSDHSLWVERYRPKTFEEFIGSESVKETVNIFLENKDIPHLMFYGPPGTGKTSLGKLLIKKIPCDSLIINASDENRVDDIRNKVQDFAMTMGVHPLKVMFLDECLEENTLVWILRDGKEISCLIKNVDADNDLVKSYNIKTSKIEWRPFYKINKGIQDVYEIEFDNGEVIICTDTHKWYVDDEAGKPIRVKTLDIISGKYDYILTTEEN